MGRVSGYAMLIAGVTLLVLGLSIDLITVLATLGFPPHELSNPWVRADLGVIRGTGVLIGALLVVSQFALWRPRAVERLSARLASVRTAAAAQPVLIPLAVTALILATIVLQLLLYVMGYYAFSADDFGRPLSAAFWLRNPSIHLGMDGWLGLAGSGWLPFSDYLLAAGLAIHPDLFVTPRVVNLIVSSLAVIAVYLLGRELFGRPVGLVTAFLFTFQPWHVWLGMSGMSSDLPSVVLIPLFGMFLIRWLRTDESTALVAAGGCLAIANGFRYENWLFAGVFSVVVVLIGAARWRHRALTRRFVLSAVAAVALVNALPVAWMAASYVVFGDPLPAMSGINAFMVPFLASQTARVETQMGIPLMAAGSFPFELVLSIGGIALFAESYRSRPLRVYLALVGATALLFTVTFGGQLAAWLHIARYLLGFIVLALPFAGLCIVRLMTAAPPWRREGLVAGCVVLVAVAAFDVSRASNYPASFPRDAVDTGWMVRALQTAGTVPADGRILIERSRDFGDLSIVALANRPERFVVLNELAYRRMALSGMLANQPASTPAVAAEGVRGTVCQNDFEVPACRDSVAQGHYELVILSTPERVSSFARTFRARSWNIGRYHVFHMTATPPSRAAAAAAAASVRPE
jgi:hypothetical protein